MADIKRRCPGCMREVEDLDVCPVCGFDMKAEMTRDLDMVCFYEERLTEKESKGESFPVPVIDDKSFGELYLRCDKGNPASVFDEIEALPKRNMFKIGSNNNVTVDNLCLKYIGAHAIGAGGKCVIIRASEISLRKEWENEGYRSKFHL